MLGFYVKGLLAAVIAGVIAGVDHAGVARRRRGRLGDHGRAGRVRARARCRHVRRIPTTYTITNQRLTIDTGLLSRETARDPPRAGPERQLQPVAARADAGRGHGDFDTAGGAEYDFTFHGVADPHAIVRTVDRAIQETAATCNRVCELRLRTAAPSGAGPLRHRSTPTAAAEPGGGAERVGLVGPLPREVVVLTAEVAVGRRLLDRSAGAAAGTRGTPPGAGRSARRSARGSAPAPIFSVPNVSTITDTGWATPIA